jgi:hypothetical protein
MAEADALGSRNLRQRRDLRSHQRLYLGLRNVQFAAAERRAIGKPWMGANGHPVPLRELDRVAHHRCIASVIPAGDTG